MRFPALCYIILLFLFHWVGFSTFAALVGATGVVGVSLVLAHTGLEDVEATPEREALARATLGRTLNRKRAGGWPWDPR